MTEKKQQEYIMLIMNCKKYMEKACYQKKTWLKHIPVYLKYYHVIGNDKLEAEYTFNEEENILWVKTLDDYNSLPNKVITSYKAIHETFHFKYLFKTDDDQKLNRSNFFDTIISVINATNITKLKTHYGGFMVDVKIPYLCKYYNIHPELPRNMILQKTKYCSGRFYFLSEEAIYDLIFKRDEITKEYLEDYAIGYHLDEKWKQHIMHITTNNYFTDIEKNELDTNK